MRKKSFKKIKWKSGAGEMVGFTIAAILLITLFTQIIAINTLNVSCKRIERVTQEACRICIAAKSLEKAEEKANTYIQQQFSNDSNITDWDVQFIYPVGFEKKWKKGNYITLYVNANVHTESPFLTGRHDSFVTMMIERTDMETGGTA